MSHHVFYNVTTKNVNTPFDSHYVEVFKTVLQLQIKKIITISKKYNYSDSITNSETDMFTLLGPMIYVNNAGLTVESMTVASSTVVV